MDGTGAAYVTGGTNSDNFPTTTGAFDTTLGCCGEDVFVTKLTAGGSALAYSTFLGGSTTDFGTDIAVDSSGLASVSGTTFSGDFPTTPGALGSAFSGGDGLFAKLNPTGSAVEYSTLLGGQSFDEALAVAVDGAGAAYLTGGTFSADFPTTPGAFDTNHNGGEYDAFVTKFAQATTTPPVCAAPPPPGTLPGNTIVVQPGVVTLGTPGNDVIYGTSGVDRIAGMGGDDVIFGMGGADQLAGGDGNDTLCGGDGNDSLTGGEQNDTLSGDGGLDSLTGGTGDDQLYGGPDGDRLTGGSGTDVCQGGGDPGDAVDPSTCESLSP